MMDAAVACQMFGLVVHPDDWKVYENTPGPDDMPIWRSNMGCTDLDIDITECDADDIHDHSCNHTSDVNIRCHLPTWGGEHSSLGYCPSQCRFGRCTSLW